MLRCRLRLPALPAAVSSECPLSHTTPSTQLQQEDVLEGAKCTREGYTTGGRRIRHGDFAAVTVVISPQGGAYGREPFAFCV